MASLRHNLVPEGEISLLRDSYFCRLNGSTTPRFSSKPGTLTLYRIRSKRDRNIAIVFNGNSETTLSDEDRLSSHFPSHNNDKLGRNRT
jgi:hypothetical protein